MANRNGQDGISTKEAIGAPGEQRGETHNDLCEICFKDVVGCICKPPQPLTQEARPLPARIDSVLDDLRVVFGVAYFYDPGKYSAKLRNNYAKAAAFLGITREQMLEFNGDLPISPDKEGQ